MITLKMYNGKWQIKIGSEYGAGSEVWQFETLKEMQVNLNLLLEIKDRFGRVNK